MNSLYRQYYWYLFLIRNSCESFIVLFVNLFNSTQFVGFKRYCILCPDVSGVMVTSRVG